MAGSSVETVTVVRPVKVIALVCGCLSLILLIIAIATTSWLETEGYRQGLWEECLSEAPGDENAELICTKNESTAWITACAALSIIALIGNTAGVVLTALGIVLKTPKTKKNMYLIAMIILFCAIVLLVIGLIIFPAMFVEELPERLPDLPNEQWFFGWSYGVAWGAAIFMFGSAILLLVDRESDTIYYREKTYYNGPQSDA